MVQFFIFLENKVFLNGQVLEPIGKLVSGLLDSKGHKNTGGLLGKGGLGGLGNILDGVADGLVGDDGDHHHRTHKRRHAEC